MYDNSSFKDSVDPSKHKGVDRDESYHMAEEQFRMFKRAYDNGHKKWLADSKKYNDFYQGEQWDEGDKAKLEAEGRPSLTVNMVLPTINVVLGEQSGRRVETQYKARRGGTEAGAFALTKLAMAVADANNLTWVESTVFSDGLIQDRGYYDVRMDWDSSMDGDVSITDLDPADVVLDPDAKSYDPNDWKEVFVTRWMSLDDIEAEYGAKARKNIESISDVGNSFGRESFKETGPESFGNASTAYDGADSDESKRMKRSVRVIERQFYKNVRIYSLVNAQDGSMRELPPHFKRSEAKAMADKYGAFLHKRTQQRVRWRVTADRFVLHDDWSPYRTFTIIPYFPYFRRGKPFGMVRNLISPQEQFNKLSSQELHIVNTTANSGWIVDKGALSGMTTDDLAAQGSKTGLVIERNPGKNIEKIKANSIPTGIDRISMKSQQSIKEISGVSDAMLGLEGGEVSGVALESKEKRGQVQIAVPLDNLARTRHMLGRKMLELFQDYYTSQRIITVTDDLTSEESEVVINQQMSDGSVENQIDMGAYDIVVSSMPARDAFNDIQFAEALTLRNAGVEIPSHRVVQYSHLAQKEEIAEEIKQMSGMGEQSPEQQEAAMRQMQAQLADMEAEVEKKRAQVQQLESQAELNKAKADDIEREDLRHQDKLEQKDAEAARGEELRRELATLSAINGLDKIQVSNQNKQPQQ